MQENRKTKVKVVRDEKIIDQARYSELSSQKTGKKHHYAFNLIIKGITTYNEAKMLLYLTMLVKE